MKLTYDRTADALVLQITGGKGRSVTTKEVHPGVHLDVDAAGKLVAIEILGASDHAPVAQLTEHAGSRQRRSAAEMEDRFGLSAETWRKLAQRERIPAVKEGRDWLFLEDDGVAYMASRSVRGRQSDSKKARRPRAKKAKATT